MRARYLIVDAHSAIFGWPEMRALHSRRMILAREALVKCLTEYQDFTGVHVVAVFDGRGAARATDDSSPGGIQIFYSGEDSTADDIIERLVAKYAERHDITVATSDLLEQQTVSSFGGNCVSIDGLRDLLKHARVELDTTIKRHNRR